ncbi:MAG: GntR family transcriptional regulator [Burkholderiaceae bacterium]|nr:GntR family transcriptional regulator [Burkholderiaceae bacterium]
MTNSSMKAITAYQEVKQKITRDIVNGRYFIGQALPAEKEFAKEFKVSIGTLRKAVDELVSEGIVIRRQGKGTFIAEHDEQRLLYYFFHVIKHDADNKNYPKVELVSFQSATANGEEAKKLELKEGSPVWRIVNRLSLDGQCVIVDRLTLSKERFPKLTKLAFKDREGSIYQLYQAKYGQLVTRTSERLRAGAASKQDAEWLNIKPGDPVIIIRRIAIGIEDEPIEWRISTLNTECHEYFSELGTTFEIPR